MWANEEVHILMAETEMHSGSVIHTCMDPMGRLLMSDGSGVDRAHSIEDSREVCYGSDGSL